MTLFFEIDSKMAAGEENGPRLFPKSSQKPGQSTAAFAKMALGGLFGISALRRAT
jgi:hypothetical protein